MDLIAKSGFLVITDISGFTDQERFLPVSRRAATPEIRLPAGML
jgi:hypothetical protein